MLYWFRTPPGVKVGRAALDEDAIRLIEQLNPGIEFDWTRILKGQGAPPTESRPPVDGETAAARSTAGLNHRTRRRRRDRLSRPSRPQRRPEVGPRSRRRDGTTPAQAEPTRRSELGERAVDGRRGQDRRPTCPTPAHARIGAEGVQRLRARYAEILVRISERTADPARREELKAQADRLNPDAWVTDDEVVQGLEQYESVFASLREVVGQKRRRRRRGRGPRPASRARPSARRRIRPARARGDSFDSAEDVGRAPRHRTAPTTAMMCRRASPDANSLYNRSMHVNTLPRLMWPCALAIALVTGAVVRAQNPPAKPQAPPNQSAPEQVIRTGVELITTDAIVRDSRGQFIADLKKDEFEIFEDGVKQQLVSFTLTHGGRVYNVAQPPPPPPQEGIILPPARPTNDAAGRIFLIFVDDLHLDFRNTGRIRDLFKKISKELIHEGDMFGIVSTGPSSISIDLTYDRKRLDQAITKITGSGLAPKDILDVPEGAQRTAGSPVPRARRVLDGQRHHQQPRAGAQPAQGVHLREQRLRLQPVPGHAEEAGPGALRHEQPAGFVVDGGHGQQRRTPTRSRRRGTSSIRPTSCRTSRG